MKKFTGAAGLALLASISANLCAADAYAQSAKSFNDAAAQFLTGPVKQMLISDHSGNGFKGWAKSYVFDSEGYLLSESEFRMSEAYSPGDRLYDRAQGSVAFKPYDWNDYDYDKMQWKEPLHYSADWQPDPESYSIVTTSDSFVYVFKDDGRGFTFDASGRPAAENYYFDVKPKLSGGSPLRTFKYASAEDKVPSSMVYEDVEGTDDEAPEVVITEVYSDYKFDDRGNWIERKVNMSKVYKDTKKKVTEAPYQEQRHIIYY